MNTKNNYKKFYSKYVVQKRRPQEYFFNKYYAHLVDPFFTKLFFDLKLTPNMVTVISGFMGVGSGLAIGTTHFTLGAIMLQLHHFIDGADGNLARLTNRCSDFGAKLDKYIDQIVRISLLGGIIVAANAPFYINIMLLTTFTLDVLVIHKYVLPFIRKNGVNRAKWKEWFLSKGIIPAFDIFTIYFTISVFCLFKRVDILIYVICIMKTIDWLYRVWECQKTSIIRKQKVVQ